MSERKTYSPPKCPYCKTELFRVFETSKLICEFDQAEGKYIEVHGEAEMRCPECNINLYNVFPDGVCNFLAETVETSV
jgi:uncharacterized protein with PIN domain